MTDVLAPVLLGVTATVLFWIWAFSCVVLVPIGLWPPAWTRYRITRHGAGFYTVQRKSHAFCLFWENVVVRRDGYDRPREVVRFGSLDHAKKWIDREKLSAQKIAPTERVSYAPVSPLVGRVSRSASRQAVVHRHGFGGGHARAMGLRKQHAVALGLSKIEGSAG